MTPIRNELPSGLRVVVAPLTGFNHAVITANVLVGSRYEQPERNGISHFLEHMLFRGTKAHPSAHLQALAFEELGGYLQAATSVDHGALSLTLPPETLDAQLDLFAAVFCEPLLCDLTVEKRIVKEEILESLDEHGNVVDADELVRALAFESDALGLPIAGTLSTVDAFDESMLRVHHAAHYTSDQTVLAIAGPVDAERLLRRVEGVFSSLRPSTEAARPTSPAAQTEPRFRYVAHADSQTALRVAFRAPAKKDPDEAAAVLLLHCLDDGMSTRLYHRICDEQGLCYDVFAHYETYVGGGLFELGAATAHEHAERVLTELLAAARELRDKGPSAAELERAKRRLRWQLAQVEDDPEAFAERLAFTELFGDRSSLAERAEQLCALPLDRVHQAARRIFCREGLSAVAVGRQSLKNRQRLQKLALEFPSATA